MTSELEHPRWQQMWQDGISPGQTFDKGDESPYLRHLLDRGAIPDGRALVPGCGRGYDVTALASTTRQAFGIDLSPEAVAAAETRLQEFPRETAPPPDSAKFICGSFFSLPSDETSRFNFIYDYTFLCALDPSVRAAWAQKMADLVQPGGELLTLIYPICDKPDGPPFAVNLELVRGLLEPVGFECLELQLLPSDMCHPGRDGTGPSAAKSGSGRWKRK